MHLSPNSVGYIETDRTRPPSGIPDVMTIYKSTACWKGKTKQQYHCQREVSMSNTNYRNMDKVVEANFKMKGIRIGTKP
jgi:hypothetical protein